MVRGALSDDHLIQLKVVTGTLNAKKHQDEILETGVRSPLDWLDGQNLVLEITSQDLTVLASWKNTKTNRTLLVFNRQACCRT